MSLLEGIKSETKPHKKGLLYTDGGSRGNPGISGCGYVLYTKDEDGKLLELDRGGLFTGEATNNVAEYHGLIEGMKLALSHEITDLWVRMDSNLIIEQMSGNWKIKHPDMKTLFLKAKALEEDFVSVDYQHVRREKNTIADSLANEVMDRHG
ncbi:MAG TPA: reverse transcriptase-like protein [Candidatus Gracilibacteria bacterium]